MTAAHLDELFARTRAENRAALIGYLPAGYPTASDSAARFEALVDGGADAVELGMPFSDPVLDGGTISTAQRAAIAAGFHTADLFPLVEKVASRGAVPVVMSYINPILHYGFEQFARDLAAAGGSGVITPDLIIDEASEWRAAADRHQIAPIFLIAPSSTEERLAATTAACGGFVYAASVMGTTGVRDHVSDAAPTLVERARRHTDLPIGVGLGVRTAEQAHQIASYADAVIVGSALVAAADTSLSKLSALASELRNGVAR